MLVGRARGDGPERGLLSREWSRLGPRAPAWARELCEAAAAAFAQRGFPTVREEDWKYTNVSPIADRQFRPAPGDGQVLAERSVTSRLEGLGLGGPRLVFVNDHFDPSLSRLPPLTSGATVGPLAHDDGAAWGIAEGALGRYADSSASPFVALNTALLRDGAVVRVPRSRALEEPVHLVFIAAPSGEATASHPRVLVVLDSGAEATVVETYLSVGDAEFFTNPVTELVLGDGAVLLHCRAVAEGPQGFHVGTTQASLDRASSLRSLQVAVGPQLGRNDLNVVFRGQGAECSLDGVYVASEQQHVDNHTMIDHAVPGCTSRQLYKGILSGRATGVFNGKIVVRRDAQRTDAEQTNQNLVLSDRATIDTKPQLEIFADDVRCTHGAAVGPPDEETLFYLRTRGLTLEQAVSLLAYGFAANVLDRRTPQSVRSVVEPLVRERVEAAVRAEVPR